MANRSKTTDVTTSSSETGLEVKWAEALQTLHAGSHVKAKDLLQALLQEASAAQQWVLARRAKITLAALARQDAPPSQVTPAPSDMLIQVHLNRNEAQKALALAEQSLAQGPQRAGTHYLKAVALSQLGEAEKAAEALQQAFEKDPSLHHQYLLEKDFDAARATPAFKALA